jgi:predicted TIM-barrel fold metal-dependent hydrolase
MSDATETTMPDDVPIIDLMIGFVPKNKKEMLAYLERGMKDEDSKNMRFPAEYMFKNVPADLPDDADPIDITLGEMDKYNVVHGLVGATSENGQRALREHPERFSGVLEVDPNKGMDEVRKIEQYHDEFAIKAVSSFPSGLMPLKAVNDKLYYPIYAKCVELGLPMLQNAGIAGPRFPSWPQHVEHFDEVCYDFPELKLVMRHGAEPWEKLAWKLMLKWPNLYYMTSAFAPKYYPEEIVKYANSRGADKIMYAGYFPMGLSLERIMSDMPKVPFRESVWPKFLFENANRVFDFKLG